MACSDSNGIMFRLGEITGRRSQGSRPQKSSASLSTNVNMPSLSVSLRVNGISKCSRTSHTSHSVSAWYNNSPRNQHSRVWAVFYKPTWPDNTKPSLVWKSIEATVLFWLSWGMKSSQPTIKSTNEFKWWLWGHTVPTFLSTLSRVSGRLMSKQMSTASASGYESGRTLS